MASIASKNLYDLLGNDPDQDPDRAPEPPTKAVDKPVARTGKRNGAAEPPIASAPRGGGQRGGRGRGDFTGNERAFREGSSGTYQNRSNPPQEGDFRGRGRGRGDRGGRGGGGGRGRGGDRHSRTGINEHDKQAGHGWGYETGNAELNDEKAGEAIAKEEEKEGFDSNPPPPVNADGDAWAPDTSGGGGDAWAPDSSAANAEPETPAEPEIQTKSFDDYRAEIAEKKAKIGDTLSFRKPNEGASKKFPEGKAFERNEKEYVAGAAGKKQRERVAKEKNKLDLSGIDPHKFLAQEQQPDRGGRGGRGGRGRGGDRDRSDRPDRGDRGERSERSGGDRGDFRGRGRGRGGERGRGGDRPDFRGGRGGGGGGPPRGGSSNANVNVEDTTAFPSLGK